MTWAQATAPPTRSYNSTLKNLYNFLHLNSIISCSENFLSCNFLFKGLHWLRLRPLCWRHRLCWLLRFLFSNKSLLLIFSLKESMPKDQIVLCLEKSQLFDNSFLCVDYGGDIVIVGHSNMDKIKWTK